ncbi:MAG: sulfotransferase [Pseudomonadota bacterium]
MTDTADTLTAARDALQRGDFAGSERLVLGVLESAPDNTDALYIAVVAARYLSHHVDALERLETLKALSPDYGRAYQEEGHLQAAMGAPEAALIAYQSATRCNPALTASWSAQVKLLRASGREAEAAQAEAQLTRLNSLPKPLLAVTNHIHEGRILRAEEIARAFLQQNPRNVEGMRLLADIGSRLGVHEDADVLLDAAIKLSPDTLQLRIDHIQVLRKRQKFAAALAAAKALLEREPHSPVFQSLYAIECMQSGDYETAIVLFDGVLARLPGDPATLTSRGHALKTHGQGEAAIESYREALKTTPHHGDAWYALANLKTYRFTDAELAAMEAAQGSADLSFMSRVHIAFALGKAFEDRGDTGAAFRNYALGNDLKRQQTRYTTEQMEAEFDAQKRHCTPNLFAAQSGKGHPAPDPIFIVGLPRAGSTLIEQILASHSEVDGTLELPNILSLAHRLRGRNLVSDRERYPRILHDLSEDELRALGEDYVENTRIHRAGAPFFTDKMPNNFRHIGLIHLILPNAKIIDARRAPLDCCWSGYKQLFAEGQEFTYGLAEIGAYYRGYVDLMDHWEQVLPEGRILRVQHEDVLDDLEGQVRRILDHCGLAFEPGCVDFHKTDRAVRTASSQQVRAPINRSGQGQWRPFAPYLAPLKSALGKDLLSDVELKS